MKLGSGIASLLGISVVVLFGNCSSKDRDFSASGSAGEAPLTVCRDGDTRECLGPGACRGAQECNATGSGFQPCRCGDGAAQGGDGGQGSTVVPTSGANTGGTSTTPGGASAVGGTAEPTPGGAAGEAGAGGAGTPYACSPFDNEGCTASQNCGFDSGEAACINAGTTPQLGACVGTSECAPGLLCQFRNCVKACDVTEDCAAAGASLKCGLGRGYAGFPLMVGSCARNCDVLKQDCPAGQACYLGSCLTVVSAGSQGAACEAATQCAKGLDCLGGREFPNCNRYCSTTAQDPCGQGFSCYPLADSFPGLPGAWGLCRVE